MTQDDLDKMTQEFFREGCIVIPDILSDEEVSEFRNLTDHYRTTLPTDSRHVSFVGETFVLRNCRDLNPRFEEILTRPSIREIVEAILGKDARFNAMNVIRNEPGQAISFWHVDDVVEFPLPPEIPRFDARITLPLFWMTVQVALSDIEDDTYGPTQYVPGSHYSGRNPNSQENPVFEGQGAKSALCRAGDIYLTNHQCWHRGAPNLSDRTRYVMQLQFAQRWADARFKGLA